jgi:hypothetical protein
MAILNPSQIHQVLREEAALRGEILPKEKAGSAAAAVNLSDLLSKHQLTADDALCELRLMMQSGDSGSVRNKAIETALKLNGLLDTDQNRPDFHVTINILDSEFSMMNPILLPR